MLDDHTPAPDTQPPTPAPNPVDAHIGARVRLLRKERGMTQEKLADALGMTFQQVQKYEHGKNRISASTLFGIARALGENPAYFYEGLSPAAAPVAAQDDALLRALVFTHGGMRLVRAFVAITASPDRMLVIDLAERLARGEGARLLLTDPTLLDAAAGANGVRVIEQGRAGA